ncbi:MAG: urease accessory protein UreD [Pseudomonadota bacterium]|nr:urease accessory protein UreD [Pseudomonadota bacterium]
MQPAAAGWRARLALRFAAADRRTVLVQRSHSGPLQVQRPFYDAGGVCQIYILHPPGGVVGGDELFIDVTCEPRARALLTTPAAGKLYRSRGPTAHITQTLRAAAGATLEWLPQESIAYAGAQVRACTRVELAGDAGFIGWEILCLGRPASGEAFTHGQYSQRLEVWRDDRPLYLEHGRCAGASPLLAEDWGLAGQPVTATLVCAAARTVALEPLRAVAEDCNGDELLGVSQLRDALVCRYRGPSAQRARALFIRLWSLLRPAVLNAAAAPPRIWHS